MEFTIPITRRDLEILARLAQAEADNVARHAGPLAYTSVVDTVLNRASRPDRYGRTVLDVISAPNQFEPVSRYGGVDRLPAARPEVQQVVADYLAARAMQLLDKPSAGNATHFLAPQDQVGYTAPAWGSWARSMRDVSIVGKAGRGGAAHVFGVPAKDPMPSPYRVQIEPDVIGAASPEFMDMATAYFAASQGLDAEPFPAAEPQQPSVPDLSSYDLTEEERRADPEVLSAFAKALAPQN